MRVILNEDVENLGKVGDVIDVKDGYGRNFLLPRGMAVAATSRNLKQMDHQQRLVEHKKSKMVAESELFAGQIETLSITIAQKVGEEDKLFGSVTNQTLQLALKAEGVEVERKRIQIDEPIRKLGAYTVPVKLPQGVVANLKVNVVAEE